ncbi:MAG: metallo-mystery pair system four-Cys motif protein [Woeseiaceae bacterium]|jgi:uncharacterized repeat protein (TIGR04052 family)|nr:metallo-mystery pair system four-Cys motif protein [Woeseiaceae bacterium]
MLRMIALLPMTLFFTACAPPQQAIEISFEPQYNGASISCANKASSMALTDLRFYVHDITLVGAAGTIFPVKLSPDQIWQSESVALLDFEDGEGACANGSQQTNRKIRGYYLATDENLDGLSFRVGVPPALNHDDPLMADAPLNYASMHWHWASGYKFLSAGVTTETDGYWVHLGSSRCAGTIGNIEGCKSSNQPEARLTNFDPNTHSVSVDLGRLFAAVDFDDGVATDCSSGPLETTCTAPFEALGLDVTDGSTSGMASIFGVGRQL